MIVESPDALLRRLEQGHWFLKHRAKGDKPHKRFVYCDGPAIYWANREDRTGKVGCLKAVGELLVVPGLASAVLFGKARLRDRQNRLFSVVSSERSLDLEVGTEAERHLWVKVFNAFAQRHSPERASRSSQRETGEPSSSGASPPHTPTSGAATPRDDGVGAALQAQLRRVDTAQIMHGVRFPKLRGTLHVCQGDLPRSWAVWGLELTDGQLVAEGHGVLPLCHATAVEIAEVRDGGGEQGGGEADEADESDDDRSVGVVVVVVVVVAAAAVAAAAVAVVVTAVAAVLLVAAVL